MTAQTKPNPSRFALRPEVDKTAPYGAWWPSSRSLEDQLEDFFAHWPTERGRIKRVLYSPPDWDDRPRWVQIPGRRVKTGCFPRDDTHQLTVTMFNGDRHEISVIPPGTDAKEAGKILADLRPGSAGSSVPHPDWDSEGGQLQREVKS